MISDLYLKKTFSFLILLAFIVNYWTVPAYAQEISLPAPGTMVHLSPQFTPALLKGIVIHPKDPFKFDFIINRGDKRLSEAEKKKEYTKLIKYFLASLAIPDEDQWVNLSPYEKDRIINDNFGKTIMGRDLLAQDYLLKQITASLIYPEDQLGKKFWDKVYLQAQKKYGITNVPVNTFNKVWILPDDASIYEKGNTVYILKNHLRVMTEQDYVALDKSNRSATLSLGVSSSAKSVLQEIILPALEKEVNEGQNFAQLRQVYSGMLLAAWFKRSLRQSVLSQEYANKAKVKGVDHDPKTNEQIYQQYLKAYKKGVFNLIKEDAEQLSTYKVPRKYFSGGMEHIDWAMVQQERILRPVQVSEVKNSLANSDLAQVVLKGSVAHQPTNADKAVIVGEDNLTYKFLTDQEIESMSNEERIKKIFELIQRIHYNLNQKTEVGQISHHEKYPVYHIWSSQLLSELPENQRFKYQSFLQDIDLVWDGYNNNQPPRSLLWFVPSKGGYVRFELFNHVNMNEVDRSTVRIFYDLLKCLRGDEFEPDYTFLSKDGLQKFKLNDWNDHLRSRIKNSHITDINSRRGADILSGLLKSKVLIPVIGVEDEVEINPEWNYDQRIINAIANIPADNRILTGIISRLYATGIVHKRNYADIHKNVAGVVRATVNELIHNGQQTIKIVDLFGGNGELIEFLQKEINHVLEQEKGKIQVEYVVVDFNSERIRLAEARFKGTNIKVVRADLLNGSLPTEVKGADIIMSVGGGLSVQVSTRQEAERLLGEIYKELSNVGYLIATGLSANHFYSKDYKGKGFNVLHASFPFALIAKPWLASFYLLKKDMAMSADQFESLRDFANRFKVGPLPDGKGSYIPAGEVIQRELPAAMHVIYRLLYLREWMNRNGLKDAHIIIWQNSSLGDYYPYLSEDMKKELGIVDFPQRAGISEIIDKIGRMDFSLVQAKLSSTHPGTGSLHEDSIYVTSKLKAVIVMVDHSERLLANAQIHIQQKEKEAGRQTLAWGIKDEINLDERAALFNQSHLFILLNANVRPLTRGATSSFDDLPPNMQGSVKVGNTSLSIKDALKSMMAAAIYEALSWHLEYDPFTPQEQADIKMFLKLAGEDDRWEKAERENSLLVEKIRNLQLEQGHPVEVKYTVKLDIDDVDTTEGSLKGRVISVSDKELKLRYRGQVVVFYFNQSSYWEGQYILKDVRKDQAMFSDDVLNGVEEYLPSLTMKQEDAQTRFSLRFPHALTDKAQQAMATILTSQNAKDISVSAMAVEFTINALTEEMQADLAMLGKHSFLNSDLSRLAKGKVIGYIGGGITAFGMLHSNMFEILFGILFTWLLDDQVVFKYLTDSGEDKKKAMVDYSKNFFFSELNLGKIFGYFGGGLITHGAFKTIDHDYYYLFEVAMGLVLMILSNRRVLNSINDFIDTVDWDKAMLAPGGIDMNASNLHMNVKGNGMAFELAQEDLAQLGHIEGLDPVIISIKPASQSKVLTELLPL